MEFTIDWATWQNLFQQSPGLLLWRFFVVIGWIPIAILFIFANREIWLHHVRNKWAKSIKYVLLAIDLPSNNEQSPKAAENMFSYLAGAHGSVNFFEKWFEGVFQLSFSYEIVSIGGYTQFLIRTPVQFRNLVESSIYSQYPDAEIVEVDDYVTGTPRKFPDEEYDLWGSEFIQAAPQIFPIKTFQEFEHQFGPPETQFKDPMASLMDLCSSLREGEQLWYQIIVIPTGFDWVEEADKETDKILGRLKKKVTLSNQVADGILKLIDKGSEAVYSLWGDIEDPEKKEEKPKSMMELKPKEKNQMEGAYRKAAKIAFLAKIRMVYLAKKDVINRGKVVNGFVGYIKQFSALDLNNLKPDLKYTMTRTAYFNRTARLNTKKTRIINNYVRRDDVGGRLPGIYNIEELATLWHFPIEASVRAPLIQKAAGRKSTAPASLPISEDVVDDAQELLFAKAAPSQAEDRFEDLSDTDLATDNLPVEEVVEAEMPLPSELSNSAIVTPSAAPLVNKSAPPPNLPTM